MDYDVIVIGNAREGLDRAISVAQSGGRAAVVESRESVPNLRLMCSAAKTVVCEGNASLTAWREEVTRVGCLHDQQVASELRSAGVDRIPGNARFISSNAVDVCDDGKWKIVSAAQFVVACGVKSLRPKTLHIDDRFVFSVESIHEMRDAQRSVIVVGAGATGSTAAIMLATLGLEVTVVDEHVSMLEVTGFLDNTFDAAPSVNIAFRLGDEVIGTEVRPNLRAIARLASGRVLAADAVLVCVGQEGKTQDLDLEAVGVGLDERGRLWCETDGRSWNPNISAVGDVVGFPRSATISNFDESECSCPRAQLCS